MADSLLFENISKQFGNTKILNNLSFSIQKGEFFSLLGPSGCGKTTLLRLVAGFERPDTGKIFLNGKDITLLPPHQRPVNTVFQNYSLFPHLSVWENIAFGLRIAKRSKEEIHEEVENMLALVQLGPHAHKNPEELSGGQKQRVAIARALINKPQVLLLDEPLAALDLKLRQKMLIELDRIHDEIGITFLFVTHDQTEAMAVSDRIAVLQYGNLEQIGSPIALYEKPNNGFVASFIGDTNFLEASVSEKISEDYVLIACENLPALLCFNDKKLVANDLFCLSIRPEKIHLSKELPALHPFHNRLSGIIEDIIYKGDHTDYWANVVGYKIKIIQPHRNFLEEQLIKKGDTIWLYWHADDGYMIESFTKETSSLSEIVNHESYSGKQ